MYLLLYVQLATAWYSYSLHLNAMWVNFGNFWVTGADTNGSLDHSMVNKFDPVAMLVVV